jgi:hypothetical protein
MPVSLFPRGARKSGMFHVNSMPFFRAERGKTAYKRSARTMLPQAKTRCGDTE